MEIRNLGGSGLRVSAVGLGCNNFGQRIDLEDLAQGDPQGDRPRHHAVRHRRHLWRHRGGSETVLGAVLGDRRKDIVLATKFGMPMDNDGTKKGASRRYIMSAVEASLKRLKTDYIDLYQQHNYDPLTPIEETLRALDDLVRQGKVRYIGCSNLPAWRVAEAELTAQADRTSRRSSRARTNTASWCATSRRTCCRRRRTTSSGCCRYFPLASGLLTGKYAARRGRARRHPLRQGAAPARPLRRRERNEDIVEKLQAFAPTRGHTMLELAFSWLAVAPAGIERDRRRDPRRAGRAERQGDRLDAERGGDRARSTASPRGTSKTHQSHPSPLAGRVGRAQWRPGGGRWFSATHDRHTRPSRSSTRATLPARARDKTARGFALPKRT